jgi:hypothetical protein
MTEMVAADLLIVGGGLGGVAGALAALESGRTVILTEESDWLGGQLTSQATPPDEHEWIEQFGATARYRRLRNEIRSYYRAWYPLSETARQARYLNPGLGNVSRLCHEPRVAAAVISAMLAPFVAAGRLRVVTGISPKEVETVGGRIHEIGFRSPDDRRFIFSGRMVLDATELGDLLPLAGIPYVTGFESHSDTREPSAPAQAQPDNVQAFSWAFAMSYDEDADHTISKPPDYEYWRDYRPSFWPGPLFGFTAPDPRTLEPSTRDFMPDATQGIDPGEGGDRDLWRFRRILARESFVPGFLRSDVTVANWPMIDYLDGSLLDVDDDERARHLRGARNQSLSMFYWLQTEAPRPDGGKGWPGLRLRGDVLGTDDGLAKSPYIRESRRIRALTTIAEQDLSLAIRGSSGARQYEESVGVGMYRIDLHPSTGGDNYIDVAACPFQIPLGALIPTTGTNLIAAAKNIGTTHITNGCYRLHPVEWNIGEVAGALAAYCLDEGADPASVHSDPSKVAEFQRRLALEGVELAWPEIRGY